MIRYYTGVGSRGTPLEIQSFMTYFAQRVSLIFTLRSGGAAGADKAFEQGALNSKIYLAHHATPEAMEIAARYHPAWSRCGDYARKLHGRNAFQVLGDDLKTPSEFLVCWTQDGCLSHTTRTRQTGGTGTAISIADAAGLPILNLAIEDHYLYLKRYAEEI